MTLMWQHKALAVSLAPPHIEPCIVHFRWGVDGAWQRWDEEASPHVRLERLLGHPVKLVLSVLEKVLRSCTLNLRVSECTHTAGGS
jgi:hypothetical protein